ncbi:PWWP domain-containing protein 5-like [Phragmites australis]|uniref:PWWP domain-containing protein 5-like n=1 Tax=Phragmites australis TaxID=29695 RepID=UPI002D77F781|nr:PWWP domain-containing protein 5-like [Phragmites australis]
MEPKMCAGSPHAVAPPVFSTTVSSHERNIKINKAETIGLSLSLEKSDSNSIQPKKPDQAHTARSFSHFLLLSPDHPAPNPARAQRRAPGRQTLSSLRLDVSPRSPVARQVRFLDGARQGEPATMRTRSQEKAAMSSDPGGGGGLGGVKREGQPAPMGAVEAAAGENLVGNSGPKVDGDALMVDGAAEEVAAAETGEKVAGDAAMTDAVADGGLTVVSDLLYETESAGMVDAEGEGSCENVLVPNSGGGREGTLGVEAGGLQSEDEATAKIVELSGYSAPRHAEAEPNKSDRFARYCLPSLDNRDVQVSDLVWRKLEGYPWWPGEIFDPSDASELALKHQIKGNHLVAYFGDGTFAWSDESQLMPFMTNYAHMEKQSSSDEFVNAVNHALEEFSRRVLSGMSCSCLPEELSDSGMSYLVENHGLREGVTCSTANRAEVLKYFRPENLLHYVKSLALSPGQGGDLLQLVIACSQLTSFYRSKGCPELASFQTSGGWADNAMDSSSTKNVTLGEDVTNVVHPNHDKPKKGRGRPRKRKPEDVIELREKNTSNLNNSATYDDFDDSKHRKIRNLDSFEDSETKLHSSFKIGECIRRAASQLTGPSSIAKPQDEPTEDGEFDSSGDDTDDELTMLKRAKWRRMHKNHSTEPKELLPQLCSVAIEPMSGNSFSTTIISYFSDYRNYVVTSSTEASIIGEVKPKRGRKRTNVHYPEVEMTDHMQDSYWSELSLHNDPTHSLKRASTSMRPRRKRRSSQDRYVPLSQHVQLATLAPKKHIQVMERPIIHVDAKMADELKPTALVLSFGRSAALPSEMDLIKMFSRHGPLKETETEVHKDTSTVKVVFKKRADAERAFSAAGKYGTFGPSLRSYRLVNMPFSLSLLEANNPVTHPEANLSVVTSTISVS